VSGPTLSVYSVKCSRPDTLTVVDDVTSSLLTNRRGFRDDVAVATDDASGLAVVPFSVSAASVSMSLSSSDASINTVLTLILYTRRTKRQLHVFENITKLVE